MLGLAAGAALHSGVVQAQSGARAADVVTPQDEFHQRAETAAAQGVPFIENFQARTAPDLKPGSQLMFSLRGTPGAKVDLAIRGVRGVIELPEVRYGEYATTYTVRGGDRLSEQSEVNVTMRFRNKVATASLGQRLGGSPSSLAAGGANRAIGASSSATLAGSAPVAAARPRASCADCASVESVKVVNLGGASAQGAQGAQGGGGAWTTASGPGDAYRYDVTLRYPDGRVVTMPLDDDPGLATGEQVRVKNGVLIRYTGEP
jgi:hypothetical protein